MPAIRIQTELPGPKSKAWLDRRAAAIPRGVYAGTPIFIRSAEGATFEDLDGDVIRGIRGACRRPGNVPVAS